METETINIKIEYEPDIKIDPNNVDAEQQTSSLDKSVSSIASENQGELETIVPDNVATEPVAPCLFVQAWAHESHEENGLPSPPELLLSRPVDKFKDYVCIPDKEIPPRALAVLPNQLIWKKNEVYPNQHRFPTKSCFGPVEGINTTMSFEESYRAVQLAAAKKEPVFFVTNEDASITHIDTSDKDKSNWIGLLRLGNTNSENMLWLCQNEDKLFAVAVTNFSKLKPLKLGYSKEYAYQYGIPDDQPILDLNADRKDPWCHLCSTALPSQLALDKHSKRVHRIGVKHVEAIASNIVPTICPPIIPRRRKKFTLNRQKVTRCRFCFYSYSGKPSGLAMHEIRCAQQPNKPIYRGRSRCVIGRPKTAKANNTKQASRNTAKREDNNDTTRSRDSLNAENAHEMGESSNNMESTLSSDDDSEDENLRGYPCPYCHHILATKVTFENSHKWRCKKFIEISSQRKSSRVPKNVTYFEYPRPKKNTRANKIKYPCACGRQFKNLCVLKRHINTDHVVNDPPKTENIAQVWVPPQPLFADHVLANLGLVQKVEPDSQVIMPKHEIDSQVMLKPESNSQVMPKPESNSQVMPKPEPDSQVKMPTQHIEDNTTEQTLEVINVSTTL